MNETTNDYAELLSSVQAGQDVSLPNLVRTGYNEVMDELVRTLNRNKMNKTGYGFCLACDGYHTWSFSLAMGCIKPLDAEPELVN